MSFPGDPSANPHDGGRPDEPGTPPGSPAKSSRVWLLTVAAVVAVAAAGVAWLVLPGKPHRPSTASSGTATSSGSTSSPATSGPGITGEAVKEVLLDGAELTRMLDQPFKTTTASLMYGGFDEMEEPSTPGDCVGVTNVAPQRVYQPADVQSYARQTWVDATPGAAGSDQSTAKVMFVVESVVALPSAAAARALFAKFAEQWKRCDGQVVDRAPDTPDAAGRPRLPGTEIHITDVRVSDTVLAASIALDRKPKAPDTRAVGVQGNCIVGALIAFTGVANATGSGDPRTSSSDAVRAMMDKAAKLGG